MRKSHLFAAIAVVALIPTLASAQNACEQRKHDQRVAGTILGGIAGAVIGSQVSGHGARTEGSVIGGVGGAIVGNQLSRSKTDCSGYGYYDSSGVWHANVDGYVDRDGHWVNARSDGFYDSDGVWHARGRGYVDSDGYWVAEAPAAGSYGADVAYTGRDLWRGAPYGIHEREDWLEQQIRMGVNDGSLTYREADRARRQLYGIRRQETALRRTGGYLDGSERADLQARLDTLATDIRDMRMNDRRRYY